MNKYWKRFVTSLIIIAIIATIACALCRCDNKGRYQDYLGDEYSERWVKLAHVHDENSYCIEYWYDEVEDVVYIGINSGIGMLVDSDGSPVTLSEFLGNSYMGEGR